MRGKVHKQETTKGYEETFKGKAYIHHLDRASLTGVPIYQILPICTFQICTVHHMSTRPQ